MENNKLGIVINTTKANNRTSGFRAIYSFNNDGWASVVRDTGAELKKVTNNAACDSIHFVQFVSNGCCYCVMQSIAGRKDYQSAWIFIHKDINLPKGTLSNVIKKVEEVLSLDVEDKKDDLDALFNKPYPTTESPSYPTSSGDTYAVRYYGYGTTFVYDNSHVLEEFLYQSEYCKYKCVFLIDKSKGQSVSDATDLSDTKLQKSIVIDLHETDGFKPYRGDSIITNAIRITEGTTIAVRWKRSGYRYIDKKGKTTDELLIKKSEYERSFHLKLFRVIDKISKKEININVLFNSTHRLDNTANPQTVFFKEEDLKRISLSVNHPKYQSYNKSIDLTKPNKNGEYIIELQPKKHIYRCCISTNIPDNSSVEFTIKTQYELHGNEIPGFKFSGSPSEDRTNKLEAAPQPVPSAPVTGGNTAESGVNIDDEGRERKDRAWCQYALIVLLFLAVIAGSYMLYKFIFPDNPKTELVEPEEPKSEWEKAMEYLSEHNAYLVKSEMDSYSELNDVYTMIKDFQFKELKNFIEKHQEDLLNLEPWPRLYDIAYKYNNKKGTFNASNGRIDIELYLKTDFESKEDVSTQSTNSNEVTDGTSSSNTNSGHSNSNSNASSHTSNTTNNSSGSNSSNSNSQDTFN